METANTPIEQVRAELHARHGSWSRIALATGLAPKTLTKIYVGDRHRRAPREFTIRTLLEYFKNNPRAV